MQDRIDRVKDHIETVKRLKADADAETRKKLQALLADMEKYLQELESGAASPARS